MPLTLASVPFGRRGLSLRRAFLGQLCGAAGAAALLGRPLSAWAAPDRDPADAAPVRRAKHCILLWMQGGPSQLESWDPKPGTLTGGPTKGIATAVPGITIAEHWPHMAALADRVAIVRSLHSKEGDHDRASQELHTGYVPSPALQYPALGSVAVRRLGDPQAELPQFVTVGAMPANEMAGAGFLGVEYDPFMLGEPGSRPANTASPVPDARLRRRLELLGELETGFAAADGKQVAAQQKPLVDRAARMSLSPRLAAFDLSREPDRVRESYGATPFGSGCLLARRLVEAGVTFIEVRSRGRWDTHDRHFEQTPGLAGEIDAPFARLLTDLAERGLLEETLVVWMGEFGRTPRINARTGRDHFPKAASVVLAGGGIRGGQVIGATSATGEQITGRPVSVPDLFATFAQALGIDPADVHASPQGRPVKVANGGQAVRELW